MARPFSTKGFSKDAKGTDRLPDEYVLQDEDTSYYLAVGTDKDL